LRNEVIGFVVSDVRMGYPSLMGDSGPSPASFWRLSNRHGRTSSQSQEGNVFSHSLQVPPQQIARLTSFHQFIRSVSYNQCMDTVERSAKDKASRRTSEILRVLGKVRLGIGASKKLVSISAPLSLLPPSL